MTATRVLLLIAVVVASVLIWRHIRTRELHQDIDECVMLSERGGGGSAVDCMESRGWGSREQADALIQELKRKYPK